MHHYNTQWRGLAKLLISVIRQCEGQMSGVSGKSFPTSFSFHTICLVLMLKQGKWYANIKYMDYTFEPFDGELLSGSDLLFFYYDVFGRNESSIANSYEWDDDIKTFLSHQKTTIEICDITQIPNNFEDNTLLFTCNKNESKSNALLRHLRNAFAHMRIQRYGDCYLLKDIGRLQKNTMLGKIKCECLKHVVYLLIKQGECFIENNENR